MAVKEPKYYSTIKLYINFKCLSLGNRLHFFNKFLRTVRPKLTLYKNDTDSCNENTIILFCAKHKIFFTFVVCIKYKNYKHLKK